MEIVLNVYDVTSTPGDPKSGVIRLNNITRAAAVGGIFHGAVQIGSVEFSYGFCERGTGVYAVEAKKNPMYQYRETISLGPTNKTTEEIKGIIQDMKALWSGFSYDLLNHNCCHFCADLAQRLGVQPVPGWLNRFAAAAATTVAVTQETVRTMQDIGQELGRLSNESFSFMRSTWQRTVAATMQQQQQIAQRLQQQRTPSRPQSAQAAESSLQPQQHQSIAAHQGPAGSGPLTPLADGNRAAVYDQPADYYGQQRSSGSGPASASNSNSGAQGGGGGLASAGQSLLAGVQQAGQQLKATTTRLGSKLQQQIMIGNAAEQESWEQALSPTAAAGDTAAAVGNGPFAAVAAAAGGPDPAASSGQQQQPGPLHQGLLPGTQPKLADQFCVTSHSIGHEDDPFASLMDESSEQRAISSSQQ